MKKIISIASFIFAFADGAWAVEGTVLWNNAKCGLNVVSTDGGYSVIQQLSAAELSVGDRLEGPLNVSEKTAHFDNLTTGKGIMMWIARHSTSKKIILDRVPPSCRTDELATIN